MFQNASWTSARATSAGCELFTNQSLAKRLWLFRLTLPVNITLTGWKLVWNKRGLYCIFHRGHVFIVCVWCCVSPVVSAVGGEVGVQGTQQSSDGWVGGAQGVSNIKKHHTHLKYAYTHTNIIQLSYLATSNSRVQTLILLPWCSGREQCMKGLKRALFQIITTAFCSLFVKPGVCRIS